MNQASNTVQNQPDKLGQRPVYSLSNVPSACVTRPDQPEQVQLPSLAPFSDNIGGEGIEGGQVGDGRVKVKEKMKEKGKGYTDEMNDSRSCNTQNADGVTLNKIETIDKDSSSREKERERGRLRRAHMSPEARERERLRSRAKRASMGIKARERERERGRRRRANMSEAQRQKERERGKLRRANQDKEAREKERERSRKKRALMSDEQRERERERSKRKRAVQGVAREQDGGKSKRKRGAFESSDGTVASPSVVMTQVVPPTPLQTAFLPPLVPQEASMLLHAHPGASQGEDGSDSGTPGIVQTNISSEGTEIETTNVALPPPAESRHHGEAVGISGIPGGGIHL